MLHAFTHNKTRLHLRYLGHREAGEGRVSEEDEITALIIGPLAFLPAQAIGVFWRALIEQKDRRLPLRLPAEPVDRANMRFWPRRGIEPDLLVELYWRSGKRVLLVVEFKWNSPLSGRDQLHRQWREFLNTDERDAAYHIFIAPEVSAGLNALGSDDIWNGRLLLRSWHDVLAVLSRLQGPNAELLGKWKEQVLAFFERLQITQFHGFMTLATPTVPGAKPVFWNELNGFANLSHPTVPGKSVQRPFFLWSNNTHV